MGRFLQFTGLKTVRVGLRARNFGPESKLNLTFENLNDILVNIDINLTLDYQKLYFL